MANAITKWIQDKVYGVELEVQVNDPDYTESFRNMMADSVPDFLKPNKVKFLTQAKFIQHFGSQGGQCVDSVMLANSVGLFADYLVLVYGSSEALRFRREP